MLLIERYCSLFTGRLFTMIRISDNLKDSIIFRGLDNILNDWYVQIRDGGKVLCEIPTGGTCLVLHQEDDLRKWKILGTIQAPITATGVADNFVLRNRKEPEWWIEGEAGIYNHGFDMEMDTNKMHEGGTFYLDSLNITENTA
jgi:hypothetical protein